MTYSEKDRVIPLKNTQKLIKDLGASDVRQYNNIGHTVVLKAQNEYYQMIKEIIVMQMYGEVEF